MPAWPASCTRRGTSHSLTQVSEWRAHWRVRSNAGWVMCSDVYCLTSYKRACKIRHGFRSASNVIPNLLRRLDSFRRLALVSGCTEHPTLARDRANFRRRVGWRSQPTLKHYTYLRNRNIRCTLCFAAWLGLSFSFRVAIYSRAVSLATLCHTTTALPNNAPKSLHKNT